VLATAQVAVNRTLVYDSLTLKLSLVYFGGVTVIQALFQTLTGQEKLPQLLVVASTLLIEALFTPLEAAHPILYRQAASIAGSMTRGRPWRPSRQSSGMRQTWPCSVMTW
jgi:hypothetical protein